MSDSPIHATASDEAPQHYYRALGEGRYEPTIHCQGAWREDEQHMGAPSGLIAHCLERHGTGEQSPSSGAMITRISYDILGVIDLAESHVHVETIRPGKAIELLEATLTTGPADNPGRPAIRARAWRIQTSDTAQVAGGGPEPLPFSDNPGAAPIWRERSKVWPGGYIAALDIRRATDDVPGHGAVWQRTAYDLVMGEASTDLARFLLHVDTMNGMAVRQDPREWLFPNVDLTVHLHRRPAYGWVGIAPDVTFGAEGVGLTSATLYDQAGPVGRAEQTLMIRGPR